MDFHFIESEIDYIDGNLKEWKEDLEKIPSQQYSNIYEEISQKTQRLGYVITANK